MRIQPSICFAACLSISTLPSVTAFYPIQPTFNDDSTKSVRREEGASAPYASTSDDRPRLTLPIRRIPVRRDNKYNIVSSQDPTQENSVAIDQDGTDLSYMVAVTIGTSKEEYHLLLDSAASNTWIMSEDCATDACKSHNVFGQSDSSSLKTADTTFSITYGTGSVSGTLGTDALHINTLSTSLTFGLASNVSSDFSSYPMDGILGLGRGDNSPGNIDAPAVMDALSTASLLKAKLFAIHLSRTKDGVNDGELDLGELNTARYNGNIQYVPTITNGDGFWEIGIDDAGVDGNMLGIQGRSAILDSGTSFILMPEDDAVEIHGAIPGSTHSGETFTVPCSTTKPVQFVFGGQTYNVSAADYVGGGLGSGNCKSNIIGRQTFGANQWLVGDVFLKNVYAVFDFDNSQVGFGVKSSVQQGTTSSISSSASTAAASTGEQSSPAPAPTSASTSSSEQTFTALSSDSSPTGSSTPQATSQASGTAAASVEAQRTGASASPSHTGSASKALSTSSSSFAFSIALGLLSLFV